MANIIIGIKNKDGIVEKNQMAINQKVKEADDAIVTSVNTAINSMKTSISEVQESVSKIDEAIVTQVNTAISPVNTTIGNMETSISEVQQSISKVDEAITTQVSTAIASVVNNAPEKFDTLKEIADWIDNDTTGAAKMANDIAALKSQITTGTEELEDGVSSLEPGKLYFVLEN